MKEDPARKAVITDEEMEYMDKLETVSMLPESLRASVKTVNRKLAQLSYKKVIDPRKVHTKSGDGRMYFPTNTDRMVRELERQTSDKSLKTIQFKTRRTTFNEDPEVRTVPALRTHMSEWVIMESGKVYVRDKTITKSHADDDDKFVAYFMVGSDVAEKHFRPVVRLNPNSEKIKNVPMEIIKMLAPGHAIKLEKKKEKRRHEQMFRDKLLAGKV